MWNPLFGDDSLVHKRQERDVYNENAVAVAFKDCISNKIAGDVPFNWRKLAIMFLKVPKSCSCARITGKRANRGVGLGL